MLVDNVKEWLRTVKLPTTQQKAAEAQGLTSPQMYAAFAQYGVRWQSLIDQERITRLVEAGPCDVHTAADTIGFYGEHQTRRLLVWYSRVSELYPELTRGIQVYRSSAREPREDT